MSRLVSTIFRAYAASILTLLKLRKEALPLCLNLACYRAAVLKALHHSQRVARGDAFFIAQTSPRPSSTRSAGARRRVRNYGASGTAVWRVADVASEFVGTKVRSLVLL